MPCNSSHMAQTSREEFVQRTARLIVYACKSLGKRVPPKFVKMAEDAYPQDDKDEATKYLCGMIRKLREDRFAAYDNLVYNARSKDSRMLADWWEEHEQADIQREAAEDHAKKRAKLIKSAKAKLTKEELAALTGASDEGDDEL